MNEEMVEWVEIIEPSRQEHMFANLTTGQCLWEPPNGVKVKPTHENQWWELFDSNTKRYYYYNATSQKTVWHKPKEGDIIPLSKLQMLKAKEEVRQKESSTTSLIQPSSPTSKKFSSHNTITDLPRSSSSFSGSKDTNPSKQRINNSSPQQQEPTEIQFRERAISG
ncbi:rho GTPase-activating protein 39-like [Clytia hemisphaerica]|uniref:rho GTPase-activating protein 39-like n=1 Tax=Clytia hemisphaerica TaxID=252671 RepID=UPI0034D52D6C